MGDVSFNSAAVIGEFMESLLGQSHADFVLYVIDNVSVDDTLKQLRQYDDSRIKLIISPTNVGLAEGNNVGIRAALNDGCDYVLVINNDTVFDPNLFAELVEGLNYYQCDMVAPKILYFDDPKKIWCAGGYLSRIRASGMHFGKDRRDDGRFDQPRAVCFSPTCCLLMRKEVFDRVGLMDANYFVFYDDTDFCYRSHGAGVKFIYLPSARLLHKVSSLVGAHSDFTFHLCARNQVYYVLKNYPRWSAVFFLPVLQVRIFLKYLVLSPRLRSFWVAQKAFWEGICLFKSRTKRGSGSLEPTGVLEIRRSLASRDSR
jgi:GT2 family glycosyltransferase